MKQLDSIYKTILHKFVTSSLLPVLIVQIFLLSSLFMLNTSQLEVAKTNFHSISDEIFSEISKKVQT